MPASGDNGRRAPGLLIPADVAVRVDTEHRDILESHVFEDIMQLVGWVRTGTPSPVNAEHARHVIEIIEACYAAAGSGMRQALHTTFPFPP